jgi:hypothetical protein
MAVSAIQQISATAKKIRRAHPKKQWKDCIKEASAIYKKKKRPAKVGAVKPTKAAKKKKDPTRQTGSSSKPHDILIPAKQPGKRKSAAGKTYYERRMNRSDKPGTLQGVNSNEILTRIKAEISQRNYALSQLQKLKAAARVKGKPAAEYMVIKKAQRDYIRSMKAAGEHIANLKKLL